MFVWRQQLSDGPVDHPDSRPASASQIALDWGFTGALTPDGVSRGDFLGLNLADHVGDNPAAVDANRLTLASEMGVARSNLLFLTQVHGRDVVVADGPWPGKPPVADAVLTTHPELALAVLVADCTPILLADTAAGVVGAVHAGRAGLLRGVLPAALEAMRDLGARSIRAAIGPAVCGRCYEVPEGMRAEAAVVSPVSATVSWSGNPAIDVAAGLAEQLSAAGVSLTWVPGCTRESPRLYSYRRRARTGRTAGVVRLWQR
ncbi:MAG TPA: peptidoglycan editing factor PgeF [Dermatophilaceae bacterium]|nr:peptidoglycan editing factor PgeF [Dermatophilaceae bacterium]